jgi:hypothetical protein
MNNFREILKVIEYSPAIRENGPPKGTRENFLQLKMRADLADFSVRECGSALSGSRESTSSGSV